MSILEQTRYFNTLGQVIATDISEAVYMRDYAEQFCEWVNGTVIKMSPVHDKHNLITQYLIILLNAYLELRPIGQVRHEPFVMRLETEAKRSNREPDLQVILGNNRQNLTPTFMNGAADIVIEVVSPESQARDYGEKLHEYERAGVREYWIIDPVNREVRFYRLNKDGAFLLQEIDSHYQTPLLADLQIDPATLLQAHLPGPIEIARQIQMMLSSEE